MVSNLNNPRVILADMNDGFLTQADLSPDGIHPNDFGYQKMAAVWFSAFSDPAFQNQISAPQDNGTPDGVATHSNVCPKVNGVSDGGSDGSGHQTQGGSGYDDGAYAHHFNFIGNVAVGTTLNGFPVANGSGNFTGTAFAQIINAGGAPRGGELDDLVITHLHEVNKTTVTSYTYFVNQGGNPPQFAAGQVFDPMFSCHPHC